MVARCVWDAEVVGSNPTAPTMKKFNLSLFILFFVLALITAVLVSYKFFISPTTSGLPTITVGSVQIEVELAQTEEQKQHGLSNRESLPKGQGMLFVYQNPKVPSFWMKDMNFPLDFVWIREGKVVDLHKNIQPEDYQPPRTISPEVPVTGVLEINAGQVDELGIQIGDQVQF